MQAKTKVEPIFSLFNQLYRFTFKMTSSHRTLEEGFSPTLTRVTCSISVTVSLWLKRLRTAVLMSCILFMHFYVLPGYLFYLVLCRPLRWLRPDLYWKGEQLLYHRLISFVSSWIWMIGYQIREWGLECLQPALDCRTLVLVNHQSTADVPMLLAALQDRGTSLFPKISWVIARLFRCTNFGFVSWIRGDFFIAQGRSTRSEELRRLRRHVTDPDGPFNSGGRLWVVVFPEGGFLYKRRDNSRRFALERDLPDLQHVTLPRVGAVGTILNSLCPDDENKKGADSVERLRWVLDVTLAYRDPDRPIHLTSGVTLDPAPPQTVHLLYRRYDVRQVPLGDPEKLQRWMNLRWTEKEQLLHTFYTTGSFFEAGNSESCGESSDALRRFNWWYVAGLHLQFLALTLAGLVVVWVLFYAGLSAPAWTRRIVAESRLSEL